VTVYDEAIQAMKDAAIEIVRLRAINTELVAALNAMCLNMKNDKHEYRDCYRAARSAIAKAEAAQ